MPRLPVVPRPRTPRDDTVRSVDRALSILQVIGTEGSIGVSEIAVAVDVHKSTAFRLLATLESRGMVEQVHDRGEYRLGYGVVQLAGGAGRRHDLSLLSRSTCQRLADAVGETVNVAINDGAGVISIDQHIGPSAVTSVNWVGRRGPLHATAAGKVFLAFPVAEAGPDLPRRLPRFTQHTITDRVTLRAELDRVRTRGYAVSLEEQEDGLVAIAAPVREFGGAVVAAVIASGPSFRLTDDTVPDTAKHTVDAADEISFRNGLPKPG